jgi:hypothetical protein
MAGHLACRQQRIPFMAITDRAGRQKIAAMRGQLLVLPIAPVSCKAAKKHGTRFATYPMKLL